MPLHYTKLKTQDTEAKCFIPTTATSKTQVYLLDQPIKKNEKDETLNNLYKEKPNTIILGTGHSYWFIHISRDFLQRNNTKINEVFNEQLPYSFLWFMCQCCRILDCQKSKLYIELMNIENKLSTHLQTNLTTSSTTDCEEMFSNITL